jgi:hypothetical protein
MLIFTGWREGGDRSLSRIDFIHQIPVQLQPRGFPKRRNEMKKLIAVLCLFATPAAAYTNVWTMSCYPSDGTPSFVVGVRDSTESEKTLAIWVGDRILTSHVNDISPWADGFNVFAKGFSGVQYG